MRQARLPTRNSTQPRLAGSRIVCDQRNHPHDLGGGVSVVVRGARIEGKGVSLVQTHGVEPDDGLEFALDDIKVFPTVVAKGLAVVGALTAGGVDDFEEVDPRVVDRRQPFPADTRGEFDRAAARCPLHDARPVGAAGPAPRGDRLGRRGGRVVECRPLRPIRIDIC